MFLTNEQTYVMEQINKEIGTTIFFIKIHFWLRDRNFVSSSCIHFRAGVSETSSQLLILDLISMCFVFLNIGIRSTRFIFRVPATTENALLENVLLPFCLYLRRGQLTPFLF
jgi:hypothetical protein